MNTLYTMEGATWCYRCRCSAGLDEVLQNQINDGKIENVADSNGDRPTNWVTSLNEHNFFYGLLCCMLYLHERL
jgi:hypothetical protein